MNMKKLLALLLTLALLALPAPAEEGEIIGFTATLTNGVNQTAEEWYADSTTRSLLTICLLLDLFSYDNAAFSPENMANPSFVGMSDGLMTIYVCGEDTDVMIFYTPETGETEYYLPGPLGAEMAPYLFEDTDTDYQPNDPEEVLQIFKDVVYAAAE